MTTNELIEMAALDTHGLLDPDDREAFEAAFRSASPEVQAAVRREQYRVAGADTLLPAVEPPIGLRARVLAAVREAMQGVSPRRLAVAGIAPTLQGSMSVHRWWRTAALGSLAAALVFAFISLEFRNEADLLSRHLENNALNDHLLQEYGAKFDQAFFDQNARLVAFSPTAEGPGPARGKATLLLDPVKKRGQLFCKDLPSADSEYEVVIVDQEGRSTRARALVSFRAPAAGVKGQVIEGLDLESSQSLAIRRIGTDEALLKTQGFGL